MPTHKFLIKEQIYRMGNEIMHAHGFEFDPRVHTHKLNKPRGTHNFEISMATHAISCYFGQYTSEIF